MLNTSEFIKAISDKPLIFTVADNSCASFRSHLKKGETSLTFLPVSAVLLNEMLLASVENVVKVSSRMMGEAIVTLPIIPQHFSTQHSHLVAIRILPSSI